MKMRSKQLFSTTEVYFVLPFTIRIFILFIQYVSLLCYIMSSMCSVHFMSLRRTGTTLLSMGVIGGASITSTNTAMTHS
jgi:hypothetical protein